MHDTSSQEKKTGAPGPPPVTPAGERQRLIEDVAWLALRWLRRSRSPALTHESVVTPSRPDARP